MTLKKVRNVAGSHRAKLLALVSDRRVSGGPLQADLGLRDLPVLPLVGKQIAAFLVPALDAPSAANSVAQTWLPGGPWR